MRARPGAPTSLSSGTAAYAPTSFCLLHTSSHAAVETTPQPARLPNNNIRASCVRHLSLVVVDEAELGALVALGDDDVAAVPPLAVDVLEAPDLGGGPAVVLADDVAADEGLAIALGQPALLEVLVGDVIHGNPAALALDIAEQPVRVVARQVVEAAGLLGGAQARGRLLDVDVGEGAVGRRGRLGGASYWLTSMVMVARPTPLRTR
ncbi:hypothetical protein ACCO45_003323 [Purpureocillium lilacinum]|uniref:Uncharacterized protein n=1 Tax=Purpureocillium lilacinum TaxID=33203 RepID=A0ACC4DZJ8_PURLI